jgi:hypothetical protein
MFAAWPLSAGNGILTAETAENAEHETGKKIQIAKIGKENPFGF